MISNTPAPVKGFRVILRPAKGTAEAREFAKFLNADIVATVGLPPRVTESAEFPGLVMRREGHRFSFSYVVKGRPLEVAYVVWGEVAVQTQSYGGLFASFPPAVQAHIDATLAAYAAKFQKQAA